MQSIGCNEPLKRKKTLMDDACASNLLESSFMWNICFT